MDFQVVDIAGGMANMAGVPLRSILISPPVEHSQQQEQQSFALAARVVKRRPLEQFNVKFES